MKADFHQLFNEQFARLSKIQKTQALDAIELFLENPTHQDLRNHPLKKEWFRYRSITAAEDLRLHFRVLSKDRVLFVAVGSHDQLYK
jgi:addiction module RelE/StbE family toxin